MTNDLFEESVHLVDLWDSSYRSQGLVGAFSWNERIYKEHSFSLIPKRNCFSWVLLKYYFRKEKASRKLGIIEIIPIIGNYWPVLYWFLYVMKGDSFPDLRIHCSLSNRYSGRGRDRWVTRGRGSPCRSGNTAHGRCSWQAQISRKKLEDLGSSEHRVKQPDKVEKWLNGFEAGSNFDEASSASMELGPSQPVCPFVI